MFALSFVGIFAALIGSNFLINHPKAVSGMMLFAGSGIIYLIFQDIAPMSKNVSDYIPATGACFGFLVGMIGQQLV
jgi:ZIP family zinc transporter